MRQVVASLATLAGLAALVYGLWLIYEPAAWLVGGVLVAFVGLVELVGPRPR